MKKSKKSWAEKKTINKKENRNLSAYAELKLSYVFTYI